MRTIKDSVEQRNTYYLLESILELNGSAKIPEIMEKMYTKLSPNLTSFDLEKIPNRSEIRWKNRIAWTRANLIRKGYLKRGSQKGVWEIKDEGKRYYEILKNVRKI